MLLTRLFHYLTGYLIISITGSYPERFLNVCSKRGILIWDVFSCSEKKLKCAISLRGFRLLPSIARKTAVRVKIIEKKGLPMVIKQYKKRKLLYIGCILFVSAFIILNQFIWKIEITGCQTVSESAVREKLEECGLKVGVFRPFLDEQKLKNNMLIKMPELAWLWADKTGSKVTVEIKEKKPKPEMYDQDAFCNIVAKKDGVIDSMIVTYGSPLVKIGDSVRAGDILVSGLLISEKNAAPRMVQSHADIYARVWYEKTRAYSLLRPVYSETGAMEKKYTLHLFGYDLALYRDKNSPFELFETQTEKKECTLFGIYMGLGITRKTYIEQTVTYEQISAESMAETSAAELLSEIDAEASADSELQNSRTTYEVIDEETISVTATAEYLENIAIKKEIMPQT